jgi:hypothetical protein
MTQSIMGFLEHGVFTQMHDMRLDGPSKDILFQLSTVDFRYWYPLNVFILTRLCGLVSLSFLSHLP